MTVAAKTEGQLADQELDVTKDVCPMTFVRVRLALDRMLPGQTLRIRLTGTEPVENVPRTALSLGHQVISKTVGVDGVMSLLLRRGGAAM